MHSSTNFNMFSELIDHGFEEFNIRYFRNKDQILTVILTNLIIEQLYFRIAHD